MLLVLVLLATLAPATAWAQAAGVLVQGNVLPPLYESTDQYPMFFGSALAAAGTVLVVGAWQANPNGALFVYACATPASCSLGTTMYGTDALFQLGRAVAASNTTFADDAAANAVLVIGTAFSTELVLLMLCDRGTGVCTQGLALEPPGGPDGTLLGWSVAVSVPLVVAGAPGVTVNGVAGAGGAYVYSCTSIHSCTQGTLLAASAGTATAYAGFGFSVAVSAGVVAVGAPEQTTPAVNMFQCDEGAVSCVAGDVITACAGGVTVTPFGNYLAMANSVLVVSAQTLVCTFQCLAAVGCTAGANIDASQWYYSPNNCPVAIDETGTLIAIGIPVAQYNPTAGVVYCPSYDLCGSGQTVGVTPNDINASGSQYGAAVAVSGTFVAVGAAMAQPSLGEGEVYTYTCGLAYELSPYNAQRADLECLCSPGYWAFPSCTQCAIGFQSSADDGTVCVPCPDGTFGQYPMFNLCQSCSSNCYTCAGTMDTCTGCTSPTPYLQDAVCVSECTKPTPYYNNFTCVATCPAGTPFTQDNICVSSCSGVAVYLLGNACVQQCSAPFVYLQNNTCVETCSGATPYAQGTTCVAACSGSTSLYQGTTCVASCVGASNLVQGNTCVSACSGATPYVQASTCVAACGESTPYNANGTCVGACGGALPYLANTTCVAQCTGSLPLVSNAICVAACSGSFPLVDGSACVSVCSGARPYAQQNECVAACTAPYPYLQAGDCVASCSGLTPLLLGTTCVGACSAPLLYSDEGVCVANCSALQPYLTGTQCTATCTGAYPLLQSGLCVASCSDPLPFAQNGVCVAACSADYAFIQNGACVAQCSGSLPYSLNQVCVSKCSGSLPFYQGTVCVEQCDADQYADANSTCHACAAPCSGCAASASSCTSCLPSSGTPYLQNATCVSACTGSTPVLYGTTCIPVCTAPLEYVQASTCVASCSGATPLYQGLLCVDACDAGQYIDSSDRCQNCSAPCTACNGLATICTACGPAAPLLQLGTCVDACSGGTPFVQGGSTCVAQCTAPTALSYLSTCVAQCNASAPYIQGTACVAHCNADQYVDTATGYCEACDASACATCSGSATTCTSCASQQYLVDATATCVSAPNCPAGTFANNIIVPAQCMPCSDPNCASCTSGAAGACTTCMGASAAPFLLAATGACVATCPRDTYAQASTCEACDVSCSTCDGSGPESCTSCNATASGQLYLDGSRCTSSCSPGSYAVADDNTCAVCDASCNTCAGTSTTCTSCRGTVLNLYNSTCYLTCPGGTQASTSNGINVCEPVGSTVLYYYAPTIFADASVVLVALQIFDLDGASTARRSSPATPTLIARVTLGRCPSAPLFTVNIPLADLQAASVGFNIVAYTSNSSFVTDWANCTTDQYYTGINPLSAANAILSLSGCGGSVASDFSFVLPAGASSSSSSSSPPSATDLVSCYPTSCMGYNDTAHLIRWPSANVSATAAVNGSCYPGYGGAPTQLCTSSGWTDLQGQCIQCMSSCTACTVTGAQLACLECAEGFEVTSDGQCVELQSASIYYLLAAAAGGALLVDVVYFFRYRRARRSASARLRSMYWAIGLVRLPMLFVGVFDTISDAFFIVVVSQTAGAEDYLYAAIAFTVAPYVINLAVALAVGLRGALVVAAADRTSERTAWYSVVLFTFFSGDVTQAIVLSQMLLVVHQGMKNGGVDGSGIKAIRTRAYQQAFGAHAVSLALVLFLTQFFVRDVAHLVIQGSFLALHAATINPIVLLALVATALTTAIGLFSFLFFSLVPLLLGKNQNLDPARMSTVLADSSALADSLAVVTDASPKHLQQPQQQIEMAEKL